MDDYGEEYWEGVLRAASEKGDNRDKGYALESEPSYWKDWGPGDETHALTFRGDTKGWHMAASIVGRDGIYVVQAETSGFVKIGYSSDIRKRVSQLQTANHDKLRLLLVIDGDLRDEERLQDRMKAHRERGEWFRPSVLDDLYKDY